MGIQQRAKQSPCPVAVGDKGEADKKERSKINSVLIGMCKWGGRGLQCEIELLVEKMTLE